MNARNLRGAALPLAAVAAAALVAGCTTVGEPTAATQSGEVTSAAGSPAGTASGTDAPESAPGLPSGVTTEMAQALCEDLDAQTQSMRTYTVTPGKVTLNTVVGVWTMRYNVNAVDLAQHRDRVDQILEVQCPTVRTDVMSALQIPDVASGLLGTTAGN